VKRELPPGWKWVALGDLCEVKRGKSITKKGTTPGDIPVIAGGQQPAYYHNQANRVGEVITVSGSGAYAGFVNFFDQPIFASDCSTLQVKGKNARMVYIYLAMKWRQQDIYDLKLGSAQPHVYPKDVSKIEIPLPPVSEQERIVGILESEMMAVEKARGAALDRVEAARALGAAFLREVFEFGDKVLPRGWSWVNLESVCKTTSGGTPPRNVKEFYEGNIPWVKSGELNDDTVSQTEETITQSGVDNSSAKIFPKGTLLIALYGATIGKLGVLGIKAATNQAVCAIFPNESIHRDYLFIFLLHTRKYLVKASFGGAQPNISQKIVRSLKIPLPPPGEQRKIVAALNSKMVIAQKTRTAAEAELEAIEALPGALLRRAFGGEL